MQLVKHPGPIALERLSIAPSHGRKVTLSLRAGIDLETAIAEAITSQGIESAWLTFEETPVETLSYVIPDKAPNDKTVAWYSKTYRLSRPGQIHAMGLIVGQFEGVPFLHGHGLWSEKEGDQKMGHIMPRETILTSDTIIHGLAFDDARFERQFDPESNFTLFQPSQKRACTGGEFALLRIRPNEDLATALDEACSRLGWQQAKVHGLGSLVRAQFDDGRELNSFATEFLILDGTARADHTRRAGPNIAIVGEEGGKGMQGKVKRGANPILITAELFLERIG